MPLLTPLELDLALRDLPGWEVEGGQLRKIFEFDTYTKGLLFVVVLGFFADKKDHHPDILVTWRKVMVSFTTHSEGGITERDVAMAKICEELYKVP
ncbi:MAG TPA: 4a-hydroxytetrahydrobiopterin dehydratase [Fimbriimonadales bacterium]|nr:4a-hydroxytetrahydrobiopterin dehydratase [Fimbriimonadales bacterium]